MTENTTPENEITFKRSHLYAALLPLAFIIGLSVGYLFWGRATPEASAAAPTAVQATPSAGQPTPETQATQEITRYDIPEDDDYVWGPTSAPITIIEFSDYQCPYCAKWHNEAWSKLKEAYPDQIRLIYRDFPLESIHPEAAPAAAAANCAGEQNAYYEYHDLLFKGQYGLGASAYSQYAQELGLDVDAFNECLQSERYADEVQADFSYAANLGVRSTPTFFVNGIPVVGAQPFEVFANLIEKELAGEIP